MFQVYNITDNDVVIEVGDRIGQGVFLKYNVTDEDFATGVRTGGFGSTNNLGVVFDTLTNVDLSKEMEVTFE